MFLPIHDNNLVTPLFLLRMIDTTIKAKEYAKANIANRKKLPYLSTLILTSPLMTVNGYAALDPIRQIIVAIRDFDFIVLIVFVKEALSFINQPIPKNTEAITAQSSAQGNLNPRICGKVYPIM